MSAMWMPAGGGGPGQTWGSAAASFVAMWVPMMAAMKLPSLVSTLLRRLRNSGKQNNESNDRREDDRHTRHAPVNGLEMYYEIEGAARGDPLVYIRTPSDLPG